MQRSARAHGKILEALRSRGVDGDVAAALQGQITRALEAGARKSKRRAAGAGKERPILARQPAAGFDRLQLVPLVLAIRDHLKHGGAEEGEGRVSRTRAERLDRAADAVLRELTEPPRKSGKARRGSRGHEGGRVESGALREVLQRLLTLTPDAVVTVRSSGGLGMWSAAATRMTGRRRWEVHRRGLAALFRDKQAFATLLADLEARGRIGPHEVTLVNAAGEDVPVRLYGARLKGAGEGARGNASSGNASGPARDAEGPGVDRYVLLLHDMTEVQYIRSRLIETEKLSAMAKIAGSVAHEFRNPLNSLFLSTDLLEDELEGSEAIQASIAPTLAAIREEIERLNQIITHYLSLSKIATASPEIVDLGAIVSAFFEETAPRLADRSVHLRVRADDGDHRVTADPNQLRRVLVNLVENAADAVGSADGGDEKRARRGTVTLLLRRMRRSIKLTVKDNGSGIPEELRTKVFEPFFTSKAGGSGLGLYLVREIAIASGGTMSLSSSDSRGTSVSIRWPVASESSVADAS